jgi:hypothetical protein
VPIWEHDTMIVSLKIVESCTRVVPSLNMDWNNNGRGLKL